MTERVPHPDLSCWTPVAPRFKHTCCACGVRHVWEVKTVPMVFVRVKEVKTMPCHGKKRKKGRK